MNEIEKEIELHGATVEIIKKILLTEKTEQKILESDRIERYEKLEILKAKYNCTK